MKQGAVIDIDLEDDGDQATLIPKPVFEDRSAEHAKMSIKELKELLTKLGVSFQGATEKDDLVRLCTKARAQAEANAGKFVASAKWQRVPDGVALPAGLEVKFDMDTGANWARLLPTKAKEPQVV